MWSKEQIAYMAGIIDGEGCIYIQKVKRVNWFDYFPRLQIVNTNEPLIRWIQNTFGGKVITRDRNHENSNWKIQHTWYTTRPIMDKLFPLVIPHLIVKRKQAELLLEFRKTFTEKESYRVTQEILDLREKYLNEIRYHNNH